tara:strand:+ start:2912 stop:6877 length:3966 start_codon:yes stop_codon:yes gene_type:complete
MGQNLVGQDLNFDHYGLEDGLSQQTILCMVKGKDGFLWLGTQEGLNRFDGKNFKIYKNNPTDSLSISGNFINRLLEDSEGNIWVATAGEGLCYFDPNTDTFKRTPITKGNYKTLAMDKSGNVYAADDQKGLVVFKKEVNFEPVVYQNLPFIITAMTIEKNQLMVGTRAGGLYKTALDNLKDDWTKVANQVPGSIEEISKYQNEWLLGTSRGLFLIEVNQVHPKKIDVIEHDFFSDEVLFIESLCVVGNTVYLGTDNGLFILKNLDSKAGRFSSGKVFKGDLENNNSITSNRVYDILFEDGLLFLGTNKLDVASEGLEVFKTINTKTKPALNNNHVFSIFKYQDFLFIGTRKGINVLDKYGKTYLISKGNTVQKLAYDVIRGMALDDDNNLWVATTKGISIIPLNNFDPTNPKIQSFYFEADDPKSLSNDKTRSIFKDLNGTIWVCTYGGGLNRFTGNIALNKVSFEHYRAGNGPANLSSDIVYQMTQDDRGRYWISTENGLNLLQFDGKGYQNPKIKVYQSDDSPNSLRSNSILSTFISSNKTLWVTSQNGIHRYNEQTDDFTPFGKEEGLSNDYVYSILQDNNENLWMSTNDGLFQFNPKTKKFTHFTQKDGLQSSEFNLGAAFYDTAENTLYFGGINGFNAFKPDQVGRLDWHGHLSFTSLKIKNKEINPVAQPKVLDMAFSKASKITLRHNDFPAFIQFTDFDFRPNKNTKYFYSLDDGNWNELGYSNELQLLQLPKGVQTLKIQGSSRDGLWTNAPLELKIKVIPHWYQSDIAYLLYGLLILSAGYGMYRFRLHQKLTLQEAERLKELDTVKSKFITNITHEFRTPLTVILGYMNTLKEQFGSNSKAQQPISAIEQNSKNLLKLVNEMLDLAKLESGNLILEYTQVNLVKYIQYVVESFDSLAKLKNIKLKCTSSVDSIETDVDTEKMRQILYNLIGNALKFSESGSMIKVLVTTEGDKACITIQDQGVGIPKEELPYIFDRFYRSSKTFRKESGSGIGLALTKELIGLMKGEILVDSVENMGTTFKIILPITKNHPKVDGQYPSVEKVELNGMVTNLSIKPRNKYEQKNTVLIVEDNTDIATYIGSCLDGLYNLLFANDGNEGYEMALAEIPDIVLTDVMMPRMNGYELTQKLQENEVTNHIPIIMITAKSLEEDKLKGLKSGADAFLTKPFNEKEIRLRIANLIEKRNRFKSNYKTALVEKKKNPTDWTDKNLKFLNKAIKFIHKNLDDSNYDGASLARDLAMSESQLYRKLRAMTDKSTAIFIRHVRLQKAKELLRNHEKTVAEIAFETGFNDANWFGKVFKEEFGDSPTQFRK